MNENSENKTKTKIGVYDHCVYLSILPPCGLFHPYFQEDMSGDQLILWVSKVMFELAMSWWSEQNECQN